MEKSQRLCYKLTSTADGIGASYGRGKKTSLINV